MTSLRCHRKDKMMSPFFSSPEFVASLRADRVRELDQVRHLDQVSRQRRGFARLDGRRRRR